MAPAGLALLHSLPHFKPLDTFLKLATKVQFSYLVTYVCLTKTRRSGNQKSLFYLPTMTITSCQDLPTNLTQTSPFLLKSHSCRDSCSCPEPAPLTPEPFCSSRVINLRCAENLEYGVSCADSEGLFIYHSHYLAVAPLPV